MVKKIVLVALAALMVISAVSCTARANYNFNLKDYVTVGEYKGIEISTANTLKNYSDAVGNLIEQATKDEDVTDAIVKDDTVKATVVASFDGEAMTKAYTEIPTGEQTFTAGADFFKLGDLDAQIIGKKTGDKIEEFKYTFASDYTNEELAGKTVALSVEITQVARKNVPELSEDFIKENTSYESIAEYKKATDDNYIKTTAVNAVVAGSKVLQYPEKNVKIYYDNQIKYYETYASYYGTTLKDLCSSYMGMDEESFLKQLIENCKGQVKRELVFLSIAEAEGLEITNEEYSERVEAVATSNGYENAAALEKAIGKDAVVRSMLCDEVQDFIVENIKNVD